MYNNQTVAVVVPCYNEEKQIRRVIETIPDFVDRIVIVNDCSKDVTAQIVEEYINNDNNDYTNTLIQPKNIEENFYNKAEVVLAEKSVEELKYFISSVIYNKDPKRNRIILINNLKNGGVGSAVARGYKWCLDNNVFCIAKLDGDGQMDPSELEKICLPILIGEFDYVKGNRLMHGTSGNIIPRLRFIGNSILSILTKIASGYWRISDTQTAYTAISNKALSYIKIHKLYPSYGYPNDILIRLNIAKCLIKEVEIKPVYNIGEESKMNIIKVIPQISWLLVKGFYKRLWLKYFLHDFHPLFLLYNMAFFLFIIWLPYLYKISIALIYGLNLSFETLFAFTFLGAFGFQSLLFAMWMDIQDNERFYK